MAGNRAQAQAQMRALEEEQKQKPGQGREQQLEPKPAQAQKHREADEDFSNGICDIRRFAPSLYRSLARTNLEECARSPFHLRLLGVPDNHRGVRKATIED